MRALAGELRARLEAIDGVTVHDLGEERSAIVTFAVDGPHRPRRSSPRCASSGVNTSLSPATYARLDFDARGLTDLVRASPHYYNDVDDLDRLVDVVEAF